MKVCALPIRALQILLLALVCTPGFATVNVKDFGAQGNGQSDDTASLNSALSAACAAAEDVYLPAGTYLVRPLAALNHCGIAVFGDGSSKTILKLAAANSRSMWTFEGDPQKTLSLVIRDLALNGGNLREAGLDVEQFQTVSITRVSVHDFGTPGYRLGHRDSLDGLYMRSIENVQVLESQFDGNERSGIELQAVHNSTVRDSTLSFNGRLGGVSEQNFDGPLDGPLVVQWLDDMMVANGSGGLDVETDPRLPPVHGVFDGNQVIDCGDNMWDAGWGLVLGVHSFGLVEGNTVRNFAASTPPGDYTNAIVYLRNAGPIQIVRNTVTGTRTRAIVGLNGAYPVVIANNLLTGNGAGIFIYNSPSVTITDNAVSDSAGVGIDVFWSAYGTITGNQFHGNHGDLQIDGHPGYQSPS